MSEEERQAIIHLLDKQARYEYCIKNNISFSDEDYEAYIIRQSMINKDKEIERLNNIIKRLEEFIEYLEKRYKDITGVIGSYGSNTDMLYGKKDMIKEILKKCKEIEQGSDKE